MTSGYGGDASDHGVGGSGREGARLCPGTLSFECEGQHGRLAVYLRGCFSELPL